MSASGGQFDTGSGPNLVEALTTAWTGYGIATASAWIGGHLSFRLGIGVELLGDHAGLLGDRVLAAQLVPVHGRLQHPRAAGREGGRPVRDLVHLDVVGVPVAAVPV